MRESSHLFNGWSHNRTCERCGLTENQVVSMGGQFRPCMTPPKTDNAEKLEPCKAEAILASVKKHGYTIDKNGCHNWNGTIATNGYGRVSAFCKRYAVHRALYQIKKGIVPKNLDVCHKCDNRKCINIKHLFVGTRSENMVDASKKKRLHAHVSPHTMPRGEKHGRHKYSDELIRKILSTKGSSGELSRIFGLDPSYILDLRKGLYRSDAAIKKGESHG